MNCDLQPGDEKVTLLNNLVDEHASFGTKTSWLESVGGEEKESTHRPRTSEGFWGRVRLGFEWERKKVSVECAHCDAVYAMKRL